MESAAVEVGPKGRIVIPAAARRALGLTEGSRLVIEIHGDTLTLMPREAVVRRARARFAHVEGDLAAELLSDRRHEADLAGKSR